jgi:hypothetical protein
MVDELERDRPVFVTCPGSGAKILPKLPASVGYAVRWIPFCPFCGVRQEVMLSGRIWNHAVAPEMLQDSFLRRDDL